MIHGLKGKIVLLPFPFDDLSTTKVRPALCLTHTIGEHEHVVVAFVTSRVSDIPLETDLVLTTSGPDFGMTGLRVSSTIQLHRLMTVSAHVLKRELGVLSSAYTALVDSKIRRLFDI